MTPLKLYHLGPSPNNMKVRVALGFKDVPYEPMQVDPQDRASIVAATGQPLTPAIVHGQVKLFDSGAILRYIDANFAGPRLYSEDREEFRAIENWEWHARTGVRESIGAAYVMAFGGIESTQVNIEGIRGGMRKEAERYRAALAEGGGWLVGGRMTAADITAACIFSYFVGLGWKRLGGLPFGPFLSEHFTLDDEFEPLRAWCENVLAYDAWLNPTAKERA